MPTWLAGFQTQKVPGCFLLNTPHVDASTPTGLKVCLVVSCLLLPIPRESEEDEDELLPTVNTLTVSNRTGAPQGTAPGAAPSGGRAPSQQPPRPQQSLSRPAGSVGAGPSNLSGGGKTATTALGKFKLSLNKKLAGAKPAGGAASGGGVPASSAGGAAAGSGGVAGPSAAAAATASEGAPAAVAAGVDGDQGGEAPGGGGGAAGGADSTPG